ncbi:hypothetical protein [Flavobacterium sp.]|uniref:hypothetical protein n=1 Tax=Flavobacterium sp. TaxID=239 RepID=UPI0028BE6CA0|nr:hypothetical protein [Flavobacterium sp.]
MFENDCLALTGETGDLQVLHNEVRLTELANLFPNVNSILIPKKAEYNLKKYTSKALLKEIDPNTDVAVEKCLLLLSNLASTYYVEDKENPENRWKYLKAEIFHQQTKNKDNTYIYPKIIDALVAGTSNGTMLEVDSNYAPNEYSRRYRIPESYYKAGLTEYLIKDSKIILNRNKIFYEQYNEAQANIICNNLLKIYPKLDLPTPEELLKIGKQLVKQGKTTKKNKILTMRNKHKNNYWKDYKNRSFIEDNIELFGFLTNRGFMIPTAGDERSGERVVDSIGLMPSWIRNEITIDGKKLVECDYRALHPNIAMKLYGGSQSFLTHESVAEKADIDVKKVKVSHLSFFNMEWEDMMKSPLFNHYHIHEADMLSKIYHDKNEHGHKITSQKMFTVEVAIMTDVIKHLNSLGIYVLYVYDALLCEEKDKAVVVETMNRIVLEHGIKTTVKKNVSAKIDNECAIVDEVTGEETIEKDTQTNVVYSITELKVMLVELKNHKEYNGVKSAISMLLDNIDTKTVEQANMHYWHFKNKEYLAMF